MAKKILNASIRRIKIKPKPRPQVPTTRQPAPMPKPPTSTSTPAVKPIQFYLNDPSTPDLQKSLNMPSQIGMPSFGVKNFVGGGFPLGSVQGQAAGCAMIINNTLTHYNSLAENKLQKWAGTSMLAVIPRAGVDLNAFYDRRSIQFLYYSDRRFGTVFAADSNDIVSHELGHAILDSYRPDTWNAASLEVASFHECFGDFTAMMHIMTYDEVVTKMIQETGGDLKKSNVATRLAEQFGKAIFIVTGDGSRNANYLRSVINDFKYVNPGTLPHNAPDNQLSAECHSFSRIFSAALYDIFVMMYQDFCHAGASVFDAVKNARNLITRYVLKAIMNVPLNVKFYESMAKTILWSDAMLSSSKYQDRIRSIFSDRNIISPITMLASQGPVCNNPNHIICKRNKMSLRLGDHLIRSQSNNPLYGVELEIPNDEVFLYDKNKRLIGNICVSQNDALVGAEDMIIHLHKTNQVSKKVRTPFEVRNGKLIRTHFSCGGH